LVPALVPASPWLGGAAPAAPRIAVEGDALTITADRAGEPARWLARWARYADRWAWQLVDAGAAGRLPLVDAQAARLNAVAVSSIGRTGVESERVALAVLRHD
jgi:hypothetical protein